jgi:glycosyltransferase involved in cell wall biosynthesis
LLIPVKSKQNYGRTLFKEDEISILFMGTMPRRIRDPHFALALMEKIAIGNIHLYIIGRSDYMNDINGCISRNKNIHFLGYVPHDKVSQYLQEADILLNIGNSFANMIPSKVFEYMSYNKPIISTTKMSNDPCRKYLEQYGKALVVNEKSSLVESHDKVVRFIQEAHMANDGTNEMTKELMKYTPAYICEKLEA